LAKKEFNFFTGGPDSKRAGVDQEIKAIIDLIPGIAKSLEEKRALGEIGSSFDAQIILLTNDQNRYKYLRSLEADLVEIFKVSQVSIENNRNLDSQVISSEYPDISIAVKKADGAKCVRCWNYSRRIGKSKEHPLICDRCLEAVKIRR